MQTDEFEEGLDKLIELGRNWNVVIMCVEGNPFGRHISLVADVLKVRGIEAVQISSQKPGKLHTLTNFARIRGNRITYGPMTEISQDGC